MTGDEVGGPEHGVVEVRRHHHHPGQGGGVDQSPRDLDRSPRVCPHGPDRIASSRVYARPGRARRGTTVRRSMRHPSGVRTTSSWYSPVRALPSSETTRYLQRTWRPLSPSGAIDHVRGVVGEWVVELGETDSQLLHPSRRAAADGFEVELAVVAEDLGKALPVGVVDDVPVPGQQIVDGEDSALSIARSSTLSGDAQAELVAFGVGHHDPAAVVLVVGPPPRGA